MLSGWGFIQGSHSTKNEILVSSFAKFWVNGSILEDDSLTSGVQGD